MNDEPPRLGGDACWDESFKEFISYCLVKDPAKRYPIEKQSSNNERKSAEELSRLCKNFFSKSKGPEYIKEKLLKDLDTTNLKVNFYIL